MTVTSDQDLVVWNRAMELLTPTYELTRRFPPDGRRASTEQLRRPAVSVPSNIAEGHSRAHRKEFPHFLSIARSSLKQMETQFLIAVRIGYVAQEDVVAPMSRCDEVNRIMLRAMTAGLTHAAR